MCRIKVIRLGKRFEDKCRPLLVGVEDLSHKTTVLSHAPSLWHHTQYKDIYIAPDLTKFQRKKNRKLVNELKCRKANGENNLVILNDTIVSRKPCTVAIPRGPVLDDPVSTSHSNSPLPVL